MSYYAIKKYTGDGATTNFAFTFPFIDSAHIEVRLDSVLQSSGYTISGSTVIFTTAPASAVLIDIRRNTSRDAALVTYTDAANLPAATLNKAALQALYVAEESCDIAAEAIPLDTDDAYNAENHRIKNIGLATEATDAATKEYVDATLLGVSPGSALPVASGGTGAPDAATARTNLGVPAGSGTSTGTNTGDQTDISGNAATATLAANSTEWDGANKTVSTSSPSGGVDGDIWIQY